MPMMVQLYNLFDSDKSLLQYLRKKLPNTSLPLSPRYSLEKAIASAVVSQRARDEITFLVIEQLVEKNLLVPSVFCDENYKSEILAILNKAGGVSRKYRTLRTIFSSPSYCDIDALISVSGVGLKTVRVIKFLHLGTSQIIVDINIEKAYRIVRHFKSNAIKMMYHFQQSLTYEEAVELCNLLWLQRKTICSRRLCSPTPCEKCIKFYTDK